MLCFVNYKSHLRTWYLFLLNSPPISCFYLDSVSGKSVPIKTELKITKSWIFPAVTRLQKASDNSFKSLNWKLITPLNSSFHLVNRHTQNQQWFYHCHAWNINREKSKLFLLITVPQQCMADSLNNSAFLNNSTSTITSAFQIQQRNWTERNTNSKNSREKYMWVGREKKNPDADKTALKTVITWKPRVAIGFLVTKQHTLHSRSTAAAQHRSLLGWREHHWGCSTRRFKKEHPGVSETCPETYSPVFLNCLWKGFSLLTGKPLFPDLGSIFRPLLRQKYGKTHHELAFWMFQRRNIY